MLQGGAQETRGISMANTAFFDALRTTAKISPRDISGIADALDTKIIPLAKQLKDLQTSVDQSNAKILDISVRVDSSKDQILKNIGDSTTQILKSILPSVLSGSQFE